MATPLSSAELNLLVYRYLLESGFDHAAYVFGYQSLVHKHGVREREVPPAALISIVQKGLQYIELEANLGEYLSSTPDLVLFSMSMVPRLVKLVGQPIQYDDGKTMNGDFSCLSAKEVLTRSTAELRALVQERRERRDEERQQFQERLAQTSDAVPSKIAEHQVRLLEGHRGEVFACNWSPAEQDLLATSASDRTARIWHMDSPGPAIELAHPMLRDKDVAAVEWSPDGNMIVTGTHDGVARIWRRDGTLQHTLNAHTGPIFSAKWSKTGEYLLIGSLDKTSSVWHTRSGLLQQKFSFHTSHVLDADWRSDAVFATCSADKTIKVCRVGDEVPVMSFEGHAKEINSIKWDPQGRFLASCSDDCTAKIWTLSSEKCALTLVGHEKEIYCMSWAPMESSHLIPNPTPLLATGSFDTTVRLWNAESSACIAVLAGHSQAVYSLAFSPDGRFLASGSSDRMLMIWSVAEGTLVRYLPTTGGILDVAWNCSSDRVAASAEDKTVTVVNLKD